MIYTAGYSGKSAAQLQEKARELNAPVLDIRLVPWSQWQFEWRRYALEQRFGAKGYFVLSAWGNLNYKPEDRSKGYAPQDWDAGMRIFQAILSSTGAENFILLCGCREYETCHRRVVAERLREAGYSVEELDW